MSLTITKIPAIMRSNGWTNGATLMDTWFSRPAATSPAYGPPETTTIRMDSWVLTFPRAKTVYDELMTDRIWATPAAQKEIAAMLRRRGLLKPTSMSFGDLTQPVEFQDADYINHRVVTSMILLDDMFAALGDFVFRVIVSGSVTPIASPKYLVTIKEVGVYVRDSYDFNGSQFLGYWDDSDNSVSIWNNYSGEPVVNKNFRTWRSAHKKGGDFIVFSDIKRTRLKKPDNFIVK